MNRQVFKRWNWQYDYGEHVVSEGSPLPASCAMAYYDHQGRLYRVVTRDRRLVDHTDDEVEAAVEEFVYDYYCDARGRVLQKRALDEKGEVALIVDFEYDVGKQEVVETAWWPGGGTTKRIVRPLSGPRGT